MNMDTIFKAKALAGPIIKELGYRVLEVNMENIN
jgi:hypothetical protein